MELKKMVRRVKNTLGRNRTQVVRAQKSDAQKIKNPLKKLIFRHTTFK